MIENLEMPSYAGDAMFFACSGIIIKNDPDTQITSFLTSLSLVRSTEDDSKLFQNMKVGAAVLLAFSASSVLINHSANQGAHILGCLALSL
jgi:phosphate/sulfate permease